MNALDTFLKLCSAEIDRRSLLADTAALSAGAAAFRVVIENAPPVDADPSSIPAVDFLADATSTPLLAAALKARDEIQWIPTPRAPSDAGNHVGLAPLDQVRDFGDIVIGMVILGPDGIYPEHSHAPQELYLPITGDGLWRYGGSDDYEQLEPDTLAYNNPNDVHAIIANGEPLLALYVLWP